MTTPNTATPVWYVHLYRKSAYDRAWWFIHTHHVTTKQETEGAYSPEVVGSALRYTIKELNEEKEEP